MTVGKRNDNSNATPKTNTTGTPTIRNIGANMNRPIVLNNMPNGLLIGGCNDPRFGSCNNAALAASAWANEPAPAVRCYTNWSLNAAALAAVA